MLKRVPIYSGRFSYFKPPNYQQVIQAMPTNYLGPAIFVNLINYVDPIIRLNLKSYSAAAAICNFYWNYIGAARQWVGMQDDNSVCIFSRSTAIYVQPRAKELYKAFGRPSLYIWHAALTPAKSSIFINHVPNTQPSFFLLFRVV